MKIHTSYEVAPENPLPHPIPKATSISHCRTIRTICTPFFFSPPRRGFYELIAHCLCSAFNTSLPSLQECLQFVYKSTKGRKAPCSEKRSLTMLKYTGNLWAPVSSFCLCFCQHLHLRYPKEPHLGSVDGSVPTPH